MSTAAYRLGDEITGLKWTGFSSGPGGGNICETTGGLAILSCIDSGNLCVKFASSIAAFVSGSAAFGEAVVVTALTSTSRVMHNICLIDGILYLVVYYLVSGTGTRAELWTDDTGSGTSFSFKATIDGALGNPSNWTDGAPMTLVLKLTSGNLVIGLPRVTNSSISYFSATIYRSTDGGATWARQIGYGSWYYDTGYSGCNLCELDDSTIIWQFRRVWLVWSNEGAAFVGSYGSSLGTIVSGGMVRNEVGEYYKAHYVIGAGGVVHNGVYHFIGSTPITYEKAVTETSWEWVSSGLGGTDSFMLLTPSCIICRMLGRYKISYKSRETLRIRNSGYFNGTAYKRNRGAYYKNSSGSWKRVSL